MSREKIEEKDQRLIKKIREIINSKEKKPRGEKPVHEPYKFWLPILFAGLMIAGLMIFTKLPTKIVSDKSEPAYSSKPASISDSASEDVFETGKAPVLKNFTDQNKVTDTKDMGSPAKPLEKYPPPVSREIVPPEKEAVSQDITPQPPDDLLTTDRSTETTATAQSPPTEQNRMLSGIQVYEMVSCSSVRQKQYAFAKTIFSLKEESTPVVWMNVLSDNPPFTLRHVYYVNERRYCEVPLAIRHHRMRTWSNVTLNQPDHIGKWRVEVLTENGKKLKHIEFTVVE